MTNKTARLFTENAFITIYDSVYLPSNAFGYIRGLIHMANILDELTDEEEVIMDELNSKIAKRYGMS